MSQQTERIKNGRKRSRDQFENNNVIPHSYKEQALQAEGVNCDRMEWLEGFSSIERISRSFRAKPVIFHGTPQIVSLKGSQTAFQAFEELASSVSTKISPWEYCYSSEGKEQGRVTRKMMEFPQFVEKIFDGEILYLHQCLCLKEKTQVKNGQDAEISSVFGSAICVPESVAFSEIRQSNIWLGRCATSNIHMDGLDNILCCIQGEKIIHLYSPWETIHLYPRGRDQVPIQSSVKSFYRADLEMFPEFAKAQRYKARLVSGESLFIPAGWWHEVVTPVPTVAVNFWIENAPGIELRPSLLYFRSEAFYQFWLRKHQAENKK
mmetsp:Transcript_20654/g.27217  ORF Transcript_20654/g.27217 Transcript_20654/m.27217 type:complete len:321 (+) Transcript_20654:204-1166(+)|eukprot:CAMPEP_0117755850 /NCGR_PEP_ID=MMETSP0947-20121206/13697_1 /TAXON_ID=44440 /ORGANISM="Chattonella subsalsa, Strain CCMP2191" /LENGTH=320 /DNA_ID=CAMNT_0005575263 /DNA_START=197 /DNA_END=1159 /DNA_ORIENTATION=-